MKKIGIIGTNCAGKTTFCYQALAALKLEGLNVASTIDQDRDFTVPSHVSNYRPDIWQAYISNQIVLEVKKELQGVDLLICDRTPLDTLAYAETLQLPMSESLTHYVEDWMQSYSLLFLFYPLPYQADGVRHDEATRDAVHANLISSIFFKQALKVDEKEYLNRSTALEMILSYAKGAKANCLNSIM